MPMYGLPSRLKRLSHAEEQVMLALWACSQPAARTDIARHLPTENGTWAGSTLLNFLYRLEEKGWVKPGREGNRNLYTAAVTKRAYGVAVMRERTASLFGGNVAEAVAALVSESSAGQAQLEKARRVLEDKIAAVEEFDLYDPYG